MKYYLACMLLILSACSTFKPVYNNNKEFEDFLSNIEIQEVETLESTELYHQLSRLFGPTCDTKYILQLKISDSISTLIITKQANVVKQNVTQICNYKLVDKESGSVLTQGNVRLVGSYESSYSPYTSYTHEKYTKHGLTKTTAEELRMRLMLYFETKNYKPKAVN